MVGLRNKVLTSGSVGMGIPMGIPVGIGWVWGLKCHPHGSPAYNGMTMQDSSNWDSHSFHEWMTIRPTVADLERTVCNWENVNINVEVHEYIPIL